MADTKATVAQTLNPVAEILQDFDGLKKFLTPAFLYKTLSTLIALIFIYIIYRVVIKLVRQISAKKFKPQTGLVADKIIKYTFRVFMVLYILNLVGVNLNALLGAAGIVGVAIGLAAQTSFSNIICGFFVLSENTIKIGDFITIQEVTGTVHSIDLLSVKVLTLNNQLIRVPNETIIKQNLKNTTYFPIRRVTVALSVSYDTDLEKAYKTLMKVPAMCPTVIDDPAPIVYFDGFGASGINMVLGVWLKKDNYIETKNEVYIAVKKTFDKEKIEIPFNQIVIHDGDKPSTDTGIDDSIVQIAKNTAQKNT